MEEVVTMSGFSEEHGSTKLYLPLVLKIMGRQLQEHEGNVEMWSRTMKSFQTKIGLCKEEALQKMALKSFETFRPGSRLQALFLDVALFIVPLSHLDGESHKLDEACSHLSLIHGCESEEIKFEMQKLQQHGFLTIMKDTTLTSIISVHDFYLELAASIEEASKYFWSSGLRWRKFQCKQAIEVVAATTQRELRTVVLELDERYDDFEVPLNFSGVRAMVLRNCMSLKILRGFANLRNLVSLKIWDCPSLKWVESSAMGHKLPYIRRFKWVNRDSKKLQQQELESSSSTKSIWRLLLDKLPQTGFKQFQMSVLDGLILQMNGLHLSQIGFKRPQMWVLDGLLLQMNGLQVLRLENTGMRDYVDMNRCLPQLRVLEVREHHLKGMSVYNLPNLERFVFFGDGTPLSSADPSSERFILPSSHSVPRTKNMLGKCFLAGCPKVQDVYVQCATFEGEANQISLESSHLAYLKVNCARLPNFSSVASEYLKEIFFRECRVLRSLDFRGGFRNLRHLSLEDCADLTAVSGFGGLPKLERLVIGNCPSLKEVSDVGDLVSLQYLTVSGCPRIGLKSMERVDEFDLAEACDRSERSSILVGDLATLFGIEKPCCFSLKLLMLDGLENLKSLNGIEYLGSLILLGLYRLQNLSCLRGIECLGRLEDFYVHGCASVVDMPSLAMLVNLSAIAFCDCEKLKSVEGCRELEKLSTGYLTGCKSLACFPWDSKDWKSFRLQRVKVAGSKFASEEVVVAWAMDEEVPKPLREASLAAISEFLHTESRLMMIEMVIDKVVQKALNPRFNDNVEDDDDGSYDERAFVAHLTCLAEHLGPGNYHKNSDGRWWIDVEWTCIESPDKAIRCVAKLPKQLVIDLCKSDVGLQHLICLLLFPGGKYRAFLVPSAEKSARLS